MAATLEELERRVVALEHVVTDLRRQVGAGHTDETRGSNDVPILRDARAHQAAMSAAVAKAFAAVGITGEPVSHEKLREMMAAAGIRPEDNLFSREIIAMRDE